MRTARGRPRSCAPAASRCRRTRGWPAAARAPRALRSTRSAVRARTRWWWSGGTVCSWWWSMRGRVQCVCASAERRRAGGFSLLEALVALLLLGLVALTCLRVFGVALRGQGRTREHLEAVALAERRMAELALLPPDSIAAYDGEPRGDVFPSPFERYRWRALLRRVDGAPALVQAAVLVEWPRGE